MKKLIIVLVACFAMFFGGCGDAGVSSNTEYHDAGSPTFPNRDSSIVRRDTNINSIGDAATNSNVDSGIDCDAYACPGTLRVMWTSESCSTVDSFSILYGLETMNIPCNRLGFVTQITPSNMNVSIGMFYNGSEIGRINQNVMIRSNEVVTINIP